MTSPARSDDRSRQRSTFRCIWLQWICSSHNAIWISNHKSLSFDKQWAQPEIWAQQKHGLRWFISSMTLCMCMCLSVVCVSILPPSLLPLPLFLLPLPSSSFFFSLLSLSPVLEVATPSCWVGNRWQTEMRRKSLESSDVTGKLQHKPLGFTPASFPGLGIANGLLSSREGPRPRAWLVYNDASCFCLLNHHIWRFCPLTPSTNEPGREFMASCQGWWELRLELAVKGIIPQWGKLNNTKTKLPVYLSN